jgi:hypothetical protein
MEYRIVCTDQSDPPAPGHGHIIAVGTGTDPNAANEGWPVATVREMIAEGTRFYTVSPSTMAEADVEPWDCPSCHTETIRSNPDQVTDNNLDELRLCSWKKKS